jgi:hypothetical protein
MCVCVALAREKESREGVGGAHSQRAGLFYARGFIMSESSKKRVDRANERASEREKEGKREYR